MTRRPEDCGHHTLDREPAVGHPGDDTWMYCYGCLSVVHLVEGKWTVTVLES